MHCKSPVDLGVLWHRKSPRVSPVLLSPSCLSAPAQAAKEPHFRSELAAPACSRRLGLSGMLGDAQTTSRDFLLHLDQVLSSALVEIPAKDHRGRPFRTNAAQGQQHLLHHRGCIQSRDTPVTPSPGSAREALGILASQGGRQRPGRENLTLQCIPAKICRVTAVLITTRAWQALFY